MVQLRRNIGADIMPNTQITEEVMPLPWEQAINHVEVFKEKAVRQFLAVWRKNRDREDSTLRWGEEVEYMLVDLSNGDARVALCADEVLRRLGSETDSDDPVTGAGWRTEFGNMMVEGVTHPPFGWSLEDVLKIEPALIWRRREVERVVKEVNPTAGVVTLAAFPLLGVPGCTSPAAEPAPDGEITRSVLIPDEAASPHPRYQTFQANYRKRKGCKVGAFIPREGILESERLPRAEIEKLPFELARRDSRERDPLPGHIYMDAQAFGACQCCMQATFLTHNLRDARYLTDQFLVLAPLFLAATAATPFLRGFVADTDTRWQTFIQSWDDRCEEELSTIRNSRTSSCDLFIGTKFEDDADAAAAANDVEVPVHSASLKQLGDAGLDPILSRHVAHLLVRDPLMVFEHKMGLDDSTCTDHFEQLQGTNWGNVRFKPPPADGSIGWRVEFRSPEVQLTDFENAAIVAVIRLLTQVIMEEHWDLTIPMSLCDENDLASAARNAAGQGLFWFPAKLDASSSASNDACDDTAGGIGAASKRPRRPPPIGEALAVGMEVCIKATGVVGMIAESNGHACKVCGAWFHKDDIQILARHKVRRLKLSEIFSGEDGIFTRCRKWLEAQVGRGMCSREVMEKLNSYMALFERRASGELPTPASFMRSRLQRHPAYKDDGVVPREFVHDLCKLATEINKVPESAAELLGSLA